MNWCKCVICYIWTNMRAISMVFNIHLVVKIFKVSWKASIKNFIKFIVLQKKNHLQNWFLEFLLLKYQISLFKYLEEDCTFLFSLFFGAVQKNILLQNEKILLMGSNKNEFPHKALMPFQAKIRVMRIISSMRCGKRNWFSWIDGKILL